jgi:hypothetical protein
MSTNETAARAGQDQGFVTAAEWFAGGPRIPYDIAARHGVGPAARR